MNKAKKIVICLFSVIILLFSSVPVSAERAKQPIKPSIGVITIFAANNSDNSSSINTSGHAFISFKNTSSSPIAIGSLRVSEGHEISFGTWGNMSGHNGIWYNIEAYSINRDNTYSNRVSLSKSITQGDVDVVNEIIRKNDTWTHLNNCSSFAVKIWNSISSQTLNAGIPNTPTSLMISIKSFSGFQIARPIESNATIGYSSNGSFVKVKDFKRIEKSL